MQFDTSLDIETMLQNYLHHAVKHNLKCNRNVNFWFSQG